MKELNRLQQQERFRILQTDRLAEVRPLKVHRTLYKRLPKVIQNIIYQARSRWKDGEF